MEVDRERLEPCEPRVALVEVTPPRLRKPDLRILEGAHDPPKKVALWNEIRIEDRDQGGVGEGQAVRQSACLVACPRSAPDVRDTNSLVPPHRDAARDDRRRFVIRVVEHLDLEAPGRPFDLTYRVEHALRHISLVVARHLTANDRLVAAREQARGPPSR